MVNDDDWYPLVLQRSYGKGPIYGWCSLIFPAIKLHLERMFHGYVKFPESRYVTCISNGFYVKTSNKMMGLGGESRRWRTGWLWNHSMGISMGNDGNTHVEMNADIPAGHWTQWGTMLRITIFDGKTYYKWPCSIAMLNYHGVIHYSALIIEPYTVMVGNGFIVNLVQDFAAIRGMYLAEL